MSDAPRTSPLLLLLGLTGAAATVGVAARWWLLGGLDDRGTALAVLGAVCLLLYALLDRDQVAETARRRDVTHGVSAVALVALAGLLGAGVVGLALRVDRVVDLTREGAFQLSPFSRAVVEGLDEPVVLVGVFRAGSRRQRAFLRRASRYAEASAQVSVELVDPLTQPGRAAALDVDGEAGAIRVVRGERVDALAPDADEAALTQGILRSASDADHVICWSVGHGEPDPDADRDEQAASAFVVGLEGQDHVVRPIQLLTGRIDPACEVVVVARPAVDLLGYERGLLVDWVGAGGRAMVLLDPGRAPLLADELTRLGVAVGTDLVLDDDPARRMAGIEEPSHLVYGPDDWADHPLARSLGGAVALPGARTVDVVEPPPPGVSARVLLTTGPGAWAETGFPGPDGRFAPEPGERTGRLPVIAAAEVDPAAWRAPARPPTVALSRDELGLRVRGVVGWVAGKDPATLSDEASLSADLGLGDLGLAEVRRGLEAELAVDTAAVRDARWDTVGDVVDWAVSAVQARVTAAGGEVGGEARARPPGDGPGRLLVVGDGHVLTNAWADFGRNRDLGLHGITWLLGETDRLAPRPVGEPQLVEASPLALGALGLVAVVLLPGLALVGALGRWQASRGA